MASKSKRAKKASRGLGFIDVDDEMDPRYTPPPSRWLSAKGQQMPENEREAYIQKAREKISLARDQIAAEQAAVVPLLHLYQEVRGVPWYVADEEIFLGVNGDAVEVWALYSGDLRDVLRRRRRPWTPVPLMRLSLDNFLWEPRHGYAAPYSTTFWWHVRRKLIAWATAQKIDISPWLTPEERWRKMQSEMGSGEVED